MKWATLFLLLAFMIAATAANAELPAPASLPPVIPPPAAQGVPIFIVPLGTTATTPMATPTEAAATESPAIVAKNEADKDKRLMMSIKFTGNSGDMQVEIIEKQIELETKYGKLTIPLSDVRSMELMQRVLPDTQKKIDEAVKNLGSEAFTAREKAQKDLAELKDTPYAALVAASKSTDQETRSRTTALINKIRQSWPANYKMRTNDLVVTSDSRISGTVLNESIKVKTKQFGEQQLKVAQIAAMGTKLGQIDAYQVFPDPGTLVNLQSRPVNTQLNFRTTGTNNGFVCGTDIYTMDSILSSTCVHAGILQLGETGIVRVTILPPQPNYYHASTRNGVTSSEWNQPSQYPVTFRVERVTDE